MLNSYTHNKTKGIPTAMPRTTEKAPLTSSSLKMMEVSLFCMKTRSFSSNVTWDSLKTARRKRELHKARTKKKSDLQRVMKSHVDDDGDGDAESFSKKKENCYLISQQGSQFMNYHLAVVRRVSGSDIHLRWERCARTRWARLGQDKRGRPVTRIRQSSRCWLYWHL